MTDTMMIPPDAGSEPRTMLARWERLWRGDYDTTRGSKQLGADTTAPGYTRSWGKLIAGLMQRQTPTTSVQELSGAVLSDLLTEMVHKATGLGCVVLRPVFDGNDWSYSVVPPTRAHVVWAERRPVTVQIWDVVPYPGTKADTPAAAARAPQLAFVETWTPADNDGPGRIETTVHKVEAGTTGTGASGDGWKIVKTYDPTDPPPELVDHPFIMSAQHDDTPRDMIPFVWDWEDCGPVPIWYTLEPVLEGLARLWDQEQDDAELTRKRVAMPENLVGRKQVLGENGVVIARPGLSATDNIILLGSQASAQHGPTGGVTPIEFSDDLVQRDRIERRENSCLEMACINPASIGRSVGGRSDSAAAKRADNQMTMNTVSGPARHAEIVLTAAVENLVTLNGWPVPAEGVTVQVTEGLKVDQTESAETARALYQAEAASTRTLVATAHPTWEDADVEAEVELMQAENMASAPLEI